MSGKTIEITRHMKYHARELRREVERQGGDYFCIIWAARFGDADGDGLVSVRVSSGDDYEYWKEGGDGQLPRRS